MHTYYYFYLKLEEDEIIVKLNNDYEWYSEYIRGDEDLIYYIELDSHYDIDDIVDILLEDFDVVEEIEPTDIDDYIKK